jgi:hypothetical protein
MLRALAIASSGRVLDVVDLALILIKLPHYINDILGQSDIRQLDYQS